MCKVMKRILPAVTLLFCLSVLFCCNAPSSAEYEPKQIVSVYINGIRLNTDVDPIIENGRTLVPIRAVSEAVGAVVDWNSFTKKITLSSENSSVEMYIGKSSAYINGKKTTLDVPPTIINDRTMVPLRFAGECFGFKVGWEDTTKTVTLYGGVDTENALSVYVLDVGQADSIFVRFPDGKTMLVDGGNAKNGSQVVDFVRQYETDMLDFLVATHPHADHIGGLSEVINKIGAEKYYMPKVSHNTATYEKMLTAISDRGGKITAAKAGVVVHSGKYNGIDFSAEIVAPVSDSYKNLNNYSAVILLSYGEKKVLLTGDAETLSENQITADIKADVLKVGHHGSDSSTGESFLKRVDPDAAIISVGEGNSYGHPDPSVVERLKNYGVTLYRTDKDGIVEVVTDGKSIMLKTAETARAVNNETNLYVSKNKNQVSEYSEVKSKNDVIKASVEMAINKRFDCKIFYPEILMGFNKYRVVQ